MPSPNLSTEIANLALSDLGTGAEIAVLETENSTEAEVMRRFYPLSVQVTLRDFPWSFANAYATLALVSEDPNDEWGYAYRYPSDCVLLKKILSGVRNDTRKTKVPYEIGKDASGMLIYTDKALAQVKYTALVTDPSKFPPDFKLAVAHRLAAYAASRLCGEDPFKQGPRAMELYLFEISTAKASNSNEQQDEEEPDSEFINSRL